MSRLTRRIDEKIKMVGCVSSCKNCDGMECTYPAIAIDKLCHYEDLEEQGLLLELPCKVGDMVYVIGGVRWAGYDWKYRVYDKAYVQEIKFNLDMFGDSFYLTKEEAEEALAELKRRIK